MEKYESIDVGQQRSLRYFTGWVIFAQLLGLGVVIMVAVWMGHYRGGFAWQSDPGREFNYHPLFMVIGLVFLYGNAILVYRVFRNDRKLYVKILHASLHLVAAIFVAVGLKAVFDSHNLPDPPIPNLYSLHSWLGICTVTLFSLQWVAGLVTFLVPGLADQLKAFYKPIHVFWGLAIFILATATCLTGMTEKALWTLQDSYSHFVPEGYLVNCLGLSLVALAATIVYIITNPNYARQPLPEEERIQLTQ